MTKRILVSGFEPYGDMPIDPTQSLAEESTGFDLRGVEMYSVTLPVNYDECAEKLVREVERVQPDAVISCGLAPGRTAVTPERVGLNVKDTMADDPIADNKGNLPIDEPINPAGPDALFSTLPYREISKAITAAGIPSLVSNTAGTYICNNALYAVLAHIRVQRLRTIAGFVHFPASAEMAVDNPTQPSLPLHTMVEALRCISGVVSEHLNATSSQTE